MHPSPLTPGPSPTTASLADARGAAGERGENIAFYRPEPYIDSVSANKFQIAHPNGRFAMFILQFAIPPSRPLAFLASVFGSKVWRLQLRGVRSKVWRLRLGGVVAVFDRGVPGVAFEGQTVLFIQPAAQVDHLAPLAAKRRRGSFVQEKAAIARRANNVAGGWFGRRRQNTVPLGQAAAGSNERVRPPVTLLGNRINANGGRRCLRRLAVRLFDSSGWRTRDQGPTACRAGGDPGGGRWRVAAVGPPRGSPGWGWSATIRCRSPALPGD